MLKSTWIHSSLSDCKKVVKNIFFEALEFSFILTKKTKVLSKGILEGYLDKRSKVYRMLFSLFESGVRESHFEWRVDKKTLRVISV